MPRYLFSVKGRFAFEASESEELPNDLTAHERAKLTAIHLADSLLVGHILVMKSEDGSVVTEVPISEPLN
jgi:hypothetical protein